MNPYPSAIAWNTAEGGTNAATVSTVNSGGSSGTAWSGVQRQGTTTLQYTSVSPLHDTMSYRIVGDGSGLANVRWASAVVGSRTSIAGVAYVSFDDIAGIASTATFLTAYASDDDTDLVYRLRVTSAGALQLANGGSTTVATAAGGAMTSATTYRVEWQINHSTGTYTIELFTGDSTTALATATGINNGLGDQTSNIRFGVLTTASWAAKFDTMAIGTAKLGPREGSDPPPPLEIYDPYPSALVRNTAEGGTNGVAVSTINSGGNSGNPWTGVQRTGTTTLTFTSSGALHDTMSYRIVGNASGLANLRWSSAVIGTRAQIAGVVYMKFDDVSVITSSATFMIAYFSDSDSDIAYRLRINSSGALQLTNAASSVIATATGGGVTSGVTYRIEWQINHSATTYTIQLYQGDSATLLASASGTSASLGANTSHVRFGVLSSTTWAATVDTLAIGTSKLGIRAGVVPPPPPDETEAPYSSVLAWNNAEGGTTAVNVTNVNSGGLSGTAWSGVQRTGTTTLQFTSSSPLHDTLSYGFIANASGYANFRWASNVIGTQTQIAGSMYIRFDDVSVITSSATFMIAYFSDSDTDIAYRIRINNLGALQLLTSGGSLVATAAGGTMSSGSTYRVEWQVNHTAHTYTIELFNADSLVALASASGNNTGLGNNTSQVRFGVLSTSAVWSANIDTIAISTTKLGPRAGVNQPPLIDAGTEQKVDSYDIVQLHPSTTDLENETVIVTWAQSSGAPTVTLTPSGNDATFPAPATRSGTSLIFQATASDGVRNAQDSVTVIVAPHSEWAVIGNQEVPAKSLPVST